MSEEERTANTGPSREVQSPVSTHKSQHIVQKIDK